MFEWTEDVPRAVRTPDRPARRPAGWSTAALVLVVVVWLVLTGWQWLQWAGAATDLATPDLFDIWPDSSAPPGPDPARAEAQQHARLATLLGAVPPGLGLLLALACRRTLAAVVLGAGAVLGLCLGLWMHGVVTPEAPEPPGPRVCQEHSGGDTTCPGG
ncbi:hypothetical protein [Modestobacter versicolor]|uniref:Ferric-dicitrate binding protein FerR (Iron transport regulator) n=1 Tax=Modestobacter versicolor TaxID=429133 RepID=A0A323V9S2_9ACTN|nr:hypothetical protein [Modestobacter versicolor]MBB3677136.1 ferric-dicitrate binding protein FerR (iron transport regulator) [Modestobacter versicolor]PZA21582.1 hypothetical protein DMO24_09560 [Modestobacter versicolor]